jgi:phage terminase large subunit-like protein
MTKLDIQFLPWQAEVHKDNTRFKVVAAGRRTGKSQWAARELLLSALSPGGGETWYIAPTQGQARDIQWRNLMDLCKPVLESYHVNNLEIRLINGSVIKLKGADRPDTLRGVACKMLVIDEYADIKPQVWEEILRPTLTDFKGKAIFIGTPKGRNHFFNLMEYCQKEEDSEWKAWHFTSYDNPMLDKEEIEAAKKTLSSFAFKQEYLASFEAGQSDIFKPEWFIIDEEEPKEGDWVIAIDLAGFTDIQDQRSAKNKHLDEHAIVVAKIHSNGWWIKEILHGRWDTRETAIRIIKAARDVDTKIVGIEKGSLKNAIGPYLKEQMNRMRYFCRIEELTHGNRKKTERIVWSLQGRMEHERVRFNRGEWNKVLLDQMLQFPDSRTHDDLLDALSYVDQIAQISLASNLNHDSFEELDAEVGY